MAGAVCRTADAQTDADSDHRDDKPAPASKPDAPQPDASTAGTDVAEGTPGRRMFGVLPNYATVEGGTRITPISSREKFHLAKLNSFDPLLYPFVGVIAAIQRSYGPGVVGYAKQYAASFTDNSVGNIMTTAVLASALHQDPRYFQRGQGSIASRVGYSASRLIIGRGDSGRKQFNVSEVGGNTVVASLSNLYYPRTERGVSDTVSRWAMQMMWDGLSNELKEFWPDVRRHLARQQKPAASP
jgi:hypothetical protein